MTEWRDVDPLPDAPPVPRRSGPSHARAGRARRQPPRRQVQLLALAGVLLVAAVVLALVAVLGGAPDGPPKGSPDAVTDAVAAALHHGSSAALGDLACPDDRSAVLGASAATVRATPSAQRQGHASVNGTVAVARVGLGERGTVTVALSRVSGRWCVAAFAATA